MNRLQAVHIPSGLRGFDHGDAATVFDLQWQGDRIDAITPCAPGTAAQGLLLPALVDVHLHLDKTHTVHETGPANGDLFRAIDLIARHRAGWTPQNLRPRMERGLQEAWDSGVRAVRTHLDWMSRERPPSVDVIESLRDAWRGRIEIQWVSLTALDQLDDLTWAGEMARQVKAAAGVLGCFIYRHADVQRRLATVFDLATAHDLDLDFHVDEGLDADATALADIAAFTLQRGWQGRVTCGHACSLSVQPAAQAQATLEQVARAGITLTALPTTNLYLQGSWRDTPVERGITRLREARAAGVRTCIASDNVADPFFPYGCHDPLEAWALGVQVAHLAPAEDWLDTITVAPARAMKLDWDGRLAPGCPADFILLAARDGLQAMAPAGRQRRICRQGQWT
ncbi:amidohydrolase family protein [Hydrogenophaga sp. XSHU_21]